MNKQNCNSLTYSVDTPTSSTMETFCTALSPYSFLLNLLELKSRMKEFLPTDVIVFQCGTCNTDIPLNTCGSIILEKPIQEGMDNVLNELIKSLKVKCARWIIVTYYFKYPFSPSRFNLQCTKSS